MRSFQQVVVFLFALLVCAFAAESDAAYDATVYVTSTVYRVNTVTSYGSAPASSAVSNSTTTIAASHAPTYAAISSIRANGTSIVRPSGTGVQPSQSQFTGAASSLNVNAYVAALAAGFGYLYL